ncbi:MAG: hypothetical protein Kow0062_23040 [Acidobacteriota bacterium]
MSPVGAASPGAFRRLPRSKLCALAGAPGARHANARPVAGANAATRPTTAFSTTSTTATVSGSLRMTAGKGRRAGITSGESARGQAGSAVVRKVRSSGPTDVAVTMT